MLESKYNSQKIEEEIKEFWDQRKDFVAEDASTKPPFSVILPPPNVTGFLHIGHALNHTIQDVLVRWHRMSGFNTLWLPGADHAGIATQSVVEKKLKSEGKSRTELGRENFIKEIWKWKDEYGDRIIGQMKRLGDSCDWDRHKFTLDEDVSKAVRRVFVSLHEKGLIYKGKKLVNWSTKLETAISDIEVEYRDVKGSLWHIKYKVSGEDQELVVATTRPETFLGDTAVCVHPDDERYKSLIGKKVTLPLINREVEVIADSYVDKDFGTGVVKITPAHDFNDYEIGQRHNLEKINLLETNGVLNENAGVYKGLHVQEARKKIVEDLESGGYLEKVEAHKQSVGHCERSGCVVEPFLSEQWFIKMEELAQPAIRAVETGTTELVPEKWNKTYFNWMKGIQDWCVSRQLWWGHRIPAWNCKSCTHVTISVDEPSQCKNCGSEKIEQESDVLDTWFSSALWPLSTLGWPEKTEALKTFYPTSTLVTGPDIIFFWVARMMMQGLEFQKDVPFRKVYLHGLVRDSQGRKMSKSLGNSIDPVEIIEEKGADALRFTLMSQLSAGRDLKFSMPRLEGYRNFINKIWNATRFCLTLVEENNWTLPKERVLEDEKSIQIFDKWIISKTFDVVESVNKNLKEFRFSDAAQDLYQFIWNDFCDWYLEFSKIRVYGDSQEDQQTALTVLTFVLDKAIKLIHPFTPFVTEEIYKHLPTKSSESLAASTYPNKETFKGIDVEKYKESMETVELIKGLITAVRNIRGENKIKVSQPLKVYFVPKDDKAQKSIQLNKALLCKMALIDDVQFEAPESLLNSAVTRVKNGSQSVEVVVPLEGLVDIGEEIKRIEKVILKIKNDRGKISGKLQNKKYLENAPEDLVEEDKKKMSEFDLKINLLSDQLSRLSI